MKVLNPQQPQNSKDIYIILRRCGFESPDEVRKAFHTPTKRKRGTENEERERAAQLCACDI